MGRCSLNIVLLALLALSLADGEGSGPVFCGPSEGARESVEISDHFIFGTNEPVKGATTLIRDFRNCVVDITVFSSALEAHWAYSIWTVAFNHPEHCVTPNACGTGDLEAFGGNPQVEASVFWGAGFVADGTGSADTTLTIRPGRTSRELFGSTRNYGLLNFGGAEIHIVIRSHGLAGSRGPISSQIGTASGACPPSPPDDRGCVNEFASFHPAREFPIPYAID
jgi:hypothetical protein